MANWAAPPATTPIATPMIGSSRYGASQAAPTMMKIFRKSGEKAGAAKARTEFRMPMANAAKLMNNRYGNITRASNVVRASLSGLS